MWPECADPPELLSQRVNPSAARQWLHPMQTLDELPYARLAGGTPPLAPGPIGALGLQRIAGHHNTRMAAE